MSLRWRALVLGEVRIRVRGDRAAFLSAAAERGLPLRDIAYLDEDIAVTLSLSDVRKLRAVCHAAHCRFRPLRRRGWPFVARRIRRQPLLVAGALLFCCVLTLLSGIIFSVSLEMPRELSQQQQLEVLQLAAEQGIEVGQPLWRIDTEAAEQAILTQTDYLTFVAIEAKPQLVITAVARRNAEMGPVSLQPGDVVARRGGVIEEILVLQGTAAVERGQAVAPGEVLIYGYDSGGLVAAQGIISADCRYESYGEWPLLAIEMLPQGRPRAGLYIDAADQRKLLLGSAASARPARHSEQVLKLPWCRKNAQSVELIYQVYTNAEAVLCSYTETEAAELAAMAAEDAALATLPAEAEIISRKFTRLDDSQSLVRMHLQLQTREDIGIYEQLDQATAEAYLQQLQQMPEG